MVVVMMIVVVGLVKAPEPKFLKMWIHEGAICQVILELRQPSDAFCERERRDPLPGRQLPLNNLLNELVCAVGNWRESDRYRPSGERSFPFGGMRHIRHYALKRENNKKWVTSAPVMG